MIQSVWFLILTEVDNRGKMQKVQSFNEKLGYKKQPVGFATKAIHSGQEPEQWNNRAVVTPLVTSNIYKQVTPEVDFGFQYSRYLNPTRDVLEKCLASIDNAKYGLTFASGVGALTAIITTLQSGDGIISTHNLYGGSNRLFRDLALKMGMEVDYVDFDDLKSLEKAFKANTKMVWMETPTNPLLTILDIKAIANLVHSKSKAFLAVDNTFLTSYFQRPLELGADVVMYSLSKFTNGHSDVIGGAVTTNDKKFYENLKYYQISIGVTPSPHECYNVIRSLKTLALRMEQHSKSSYAVAQYLDAHPKVVKVFHPSLKTHVNHEIALAQSYGHSGIMSFYIRGSLEHSKKFFQSLKLVIVAQSLGGCETVASFPWVMSHSDVEEKKRIAIGITDNLIRISIGLEDVDEIIADIDQALRQV